MGILIVRTMTIQTAVLTILKRLEKARHESS